MRTEELKCCPFCNSNDIAVHEHFTVGGYMVMCHNCTAEGPLHDTRELASEWWNRRAAPAAGTVERDAERLDFMISEECQIEHMTRPGAAPLCRVHWPWEGQAMRAWSASGREAIDAAIEARKNEKDSP
jgi:Lar family restriction alleviation protein